MSVLSEQQISGCVSYQAMWLFYCPTTLLFYCLTTLLFCCPTTLPFYCPTMLLFYCPTTWHACHFRDCRMSLRADLRLSRRFLTSISTHVHKQNNMYNLFLGAVVLYILDTGCLVHKYLPPQCCDRGTIRLPRPK
jgi:hypothetical protein